MNKNNKACKDCGKIFHLNAFPYHPSTSDRRMGMCKGCYRQRLQDAHDQRHNKKNQLLVDMILNEIDKRIITLQTKRKKYLRGNTTIPKSTINAIIDNL